MIFRIRHLECPRCEETFRLRCVLTGESELVPDCPECGWTLGMESIDHDERERRGVVLIHRPPVYETGALPTELPRTTSEILSGRSTSPAESGLWTRTTAAGNGSEVGRTLDAAMVIDIE